MIRQTKSAISLFLLLLFLHSFSNKNISHWKNIGFEKSATKVNPRYQTFVKRKGDRTNRYINCKMTNKELIDFFKKLFETNKRNIQRNTENQKIPKIIHQIWLGSEFPDRYATLANTWKNHHPDWEYKLWTEKELETFDMHNRDLFDQASNYAEKANILRYEILYQFGGLYVDTDFKCLKPFDILNESFEFYCGVETIRRQVNISNALIGAIPKHPIMEYCVKKIKKNIDYWNELGFSEPLPWLPTCTRAGIFYFTKSFVTVTKRLNEEKRKKVIALPPSYLYPINLIRTGNSKGFYESFGIHLYDGTWFKKNKTHNQKSKKKKI